jgi:predicted porin
MKSIVKAGLATLACCAAAGTWAQSSVTVYGLVDQAVGKNIGSSAKGVFDSTGSRVGFKGEEDLGGGMKASFLMELRFSPDTGQTSTPFFKGGSWVALGGEWGKVTLGRQWSQAFLKSQYASDPFGMSTVAGVNFGTVGCGGSGGCAGAFWVDNAVTYENAIGPFSFGVQMGVDKPDFAGAKRPFNFGIGWGDGPLYLGFGHESHESVFSALGAGGKAEWNHFTANYDFGVAKLITGYGWGHDNDEARRRNTVVGLTVPVGAGRVVGQVNRHKQAGETVVSQVAVGYQHFLSKRTTLFATLTRDSKSSSKSGYDLGILHTF